MIPTNLKTNGLQFSNSILRIFCYNDAMRFLDFCSHYSLHLRKYSEDESYNEENLHPLW